MAPAAAPIGTQWVVLRAASLRWCALQVPSPVVTLLGLTRGGERDGRRIAFLDRGQGVVRVVPAPRASGELDRGSIPGPVLGSSMPSEGFLFTLPRGVQRHLGLRTFRRVGGLARGTDDLVAWVTPAPESGPALGRVYLVRSHFRDLISVREPLGADRPLEPAAGGPDPRADRNDGRGPPRPALRR